MFCVGWLQKSERGRSTLCLHRLLGLSGSARLDFGAVFFAQLHPARRAFPCFLLGLGHVERKRRPWRPKIDVACILVAFVARSPAFVFASSSASRSSSGYISDDAFRPLHVAIDYRVINRQD